MSWNWMIRLLLIVALCIYLLISRAMLRNREKYHGVLESGPLNIFFVVLYTSVNISFITFSSYVILNCSNDSLIYIMFSM